MTFKNEFSHNILHNETILKAISMKDVLMCFDEIFAGCSEIFSIEIFSVKYFQLKYLQ